MQGVEYISAAITKCAYKGSNLFFFTASAVQLTKFLAEIQIVGLTLQTE